MGIPFKYSHNGTFSKFNYYPNSPPSTTKSSILTEYLSNGFTEAFLEKYQRELTVAASSLSVIILIILGSCLWCLVGLVKQKYDKNNSVGVEEDVGGSTGAGDSTSSTNKKSGSDELDSSCSYASGTTKCRDAVGGATSHSGKGKWCGNSSSKGIPIISKIFSKQNGNGARILAQHRNIITPDKSIPFIIPTIQLPAQPSDSSRRPDSSRIFPDDLHPHSSSPSSPLDPQPSTSRSANSKHQTLLQAQQFFPQLEHPEADSCPLIAFSLYYEISSQILNVRLLEGRNFPDTLVHTVAVKIYPGRASKQHTKEFKARSPVYNQEFCFHVRKSGLHTKILKLRAVIPGNPKRVIGYVNVALKDLPGFDHVAALGEREDGEEHDFVEDLKTTQLWRRVELPSEGGDGVKLQVSLKWSPEPTPGLLTLKIIEASGLHENRDCDYTSSYVKVTLQQQGRSIKTRKTQLVRWGSVPVFDDVFVLTIPRELLPQISFLLVVMARGRLGSKAVLGKICVGPVPYSVNATSCSSSPSGTEFWEDMCHQPDLEIVRWLHLLP